MSNKQDLKEREQNVDISEGRYFQTEQETSTKILETGTWMYVEETQGSLV